jgi:hypothetical protein
MKYKVHNPITDEISEFDTDVSPTAYDDAMKALVETQNALLERESVRFQINKVIVEGSNTTWSVANLDSDPEESTYLVFNSSTGQYQECSTLTEAKNVDQQMKNDFLASISLDKLYEVSEPST